MREAEEARQLLAQQKYKDAGDVLDSLLTLQKENDELWYLRGIVSLKMKSYDAAQEYFERAIFLRKKAEYYKMKGMAHFEIFELGAAVDCFLASLTLQPADAISHFFLATCYMLLDDPRSDEHIKKAHEIDAKKTKQLLSNFYALFLQNDPRLSDAQKRKIQDRIKKIRS